MSKNIVVTLKLAVIKKKSNGDLQLQKQTNKDKKEQKQKENPGSLSLLNSSYQINNQFLLFLLLHLLYFCILFYISTVIFIFQVHAAFQQDNCNNCIISLTTTRNMYT